MTRGIGCGLAAAALLVAGAPGWALAQEKVAAVVLVWGGGTTPEEGQAALERYKQRYENWARVVELGGGYPRVVASDDVEGLKPGFHVVLLGACKPGEEADVLRAIRALEPQVYPRQVRVPASEVACPAVGEDYLGRWTLWRREVKTLGGRQMAVAAFEVRRKGEGYDHRAYHLVFTSRDRDGAVLSEAGKSFGSGDGHSWCEDELGLWQTRSGYQAGATVWTQVCTTPSIVDVGITVTLDAAGKPVVKTKQDTLHQGECDI